MFCCSDCARGIIQSGIKRVVAPTPDVDHEKWGEHFKAAIRMLEEAKVEISLI
jgi:dCMP deaminase